MQEIWKPFPWFNIQFTNEPMYLVSNKWRIKSQRYSYAYILPTNIQSSWYSYFQFTINKKRHSFLVHRAVLLAFEWPSELECNHKDGNKLNNHLDNLEYCTRSHNVQHAHDTGLKVAIKWKKHHFYNKTGKKHPRSIPVLQLDGNWTIIKEWASMNLIEINKWWHRSHISKSIKENKRAYWFFWKKA